MTNYNLGKIYKIVRKSDNVLIYVGSTCEPTLCRRLDKHKQTAKQYPNRKIFRTIFYNDGWNNHQILLIKLYPCNSRDELHSEEARFIRCLKPIGNNNIPMRTDKEYKIENKDKIKLQSKTYNINNQEKIKQYYLDNCEKIKSRVNNFRKENPEIMKERKRLERIKNLDKYKAREQKLITCCCGIKYTQVHRTRHEQSKKHINSIPVQFKIIEQMHNNRKQYIFPVLPTL